MDWTATLLAATGVGADASVLLDGVDLAPVFDDPAWQRPGRDERERANLARREPGRLAELREAWEDWNASLPPIPADARVGRPYTEEDIPAP